MNQEKFGQLIKEIRKTNHLTQKQLAEKYHVTFQAVSKWERGLNMPDMVLIRQISKDFNISLEELFDGEIKTTKKNNNKRILFYLETFSLLLIVFFLFYSLNKNKSDFQFKTLSSECKNFNISGNIAYNESKSAIYISNIEYCGEVNEEEYQTIECTLYESNEEIEKKISSYKYEGTTKITLEKFLQEITFSIDNYKKVCEFYKEESLFISIKATTEKDRNITYTIPLKLESCSNNSTKS